MLDKVTIHVQTRQDIELSKINGKDRLTCPNQHDWARYGSILGAIAYWFNYAVKCEIVDKNNNLIAVVYVNKNSFVKWYKDDNRIEIGINIKNMIANYRRAHPVRVVPPQATTLSTPPPVSDEILPITLPPQAAPTDLTEEQKVAFLLKMRNQLEQKIKERIAAKKDAPEAEALAKNEREQLTHFDKRVGKAVLDRSYKNEATMKEAILQEMEKQQDIPLHHYVGALQGAKPTTSISDVTSPIISSALQDFSKMKTEEIVERLKGSKDYTWTANLSDDQILDVLNDLHKAKPDDQMHRALLTNKEGKTRTEVLRRASGVFIGEEFAPVLDSGEWKVVFDNSSPSRLSKINFRDLDKAVKDPIKGLYDAAITDKVLSALNIDELKQLYKKSPYPSPSWEKKLNPNQRQQLNLPPASASAQPNTATTPPVESELFKKIKANMQEAPKLTDGEVVELINTWPDHEQKLLDDFIRNVQLRLIQKPDLFFGIKQAQLFKAIGPESWSMYINNHDQDPRFKQIDFSQYPKAYAIIPYTNMMYFNRLSPKQQKDINDSKKNADPVFLATLIFSPVSNWQITEAEVDKICDSAKAIDIAGVNALLNYKITQTRIDKLFPRSEYRAGDKESLTVKRLLGVYGENVPKIAPFLPPEYLTTLSEKFDVSKYTQKK